MNQTLGITDLQFLIVPCFVIHLDLQGINFKKLGSALGLVVPFSSGSGSIVKVTYQLGNVQTTDERLGGRYILLTIGQTPFDPTRAWRA
jgi:hypothetical protein